MSEIIDLNALTPQLRRVVRLAIIETERDASGHDGKTDISSMMVAALQDDNNVLAELLHACGLSINDLRRGDFTPRLVSKPQPTS
jgi:hypothetical protein